MLNKINQRGWLITSLIVTLSSLGAIYYIITNVWPNRETLFALPQFLLLLALFFFLGGGVIPLSLYLNRRFAKTGWLERDRFRLVRQGSWLGLWGVLLAYLQLFRALNWTIALALMAVFGLIEAFFLTRE